MRRATTATRVALGLVLALFLGACGIVGGEEPLTVTATFDDVIDLVPRAGVRAGDVPIGVVTDIELTEGAEALVTMEIERDTGLPGDVMASLAKTGLLGERYVDLRPTGESGEIADGQHIEDTRVVGDFEEFVEASNGVLAFVAADQLSAAVTTGAQAFGGRGGLIGSFIENVEGVIGRYDEGSEDLVHLIEAVDELTVAMAPDAEANAAALATLNETAEALDAQDERLIDALEDVTRLSIVGARILDDHEQEIDNFFRRLRQITRQVNRYPDALERILVYGPRHNLHVPGGVVNEEAQVWLDFIICGYNETEGDPTRDCTPPNPGESGEPPPFQPNPESCNANHEGCPKRPSEPSPTDEDDGGDAASHSHDHEGAHTGGFR
ncbi:MAG: MCE family protein [Actinobacteria bacterium]|nr:MCE family protein [Actinomycetota bacterium]